MRSVLSLSLFLLGLSACSTYRPQTRNPKIENVLDRAERTATPEGRKILITSRQMIDKGEILKGSCWDYINTVYNRADYPAKKRLTVFKSKMKGPFADEKEIQAGDWLYYINHSYKKIDHSGVFISWVNFDAKIVLIMSYAGEKRRSPARYQNYDLSNVYNIIRPASLP